MSNNTWDQQEESKLANYLVNQVCNKASGRRDNECINNYPRDVYFIGNLRPRPEDPIEQEERTDHLNEMLTKLSPMAFGAEFLLQIGNEPIEITVTVDWSCYYRILPNYIQQCEHQHLTINRENITGNQNRKEIQTANEDTRKNEEDVDSLAIDQTVEPDSAELLGTHNDRRNTQSPRDSLFIRFKKVTCEASGHIILSSNDGRLFVDSTTLQASLAEEALRAQQISLADNERIKTNNLPDSKILVPENVLASEESYLNFLTTLSTNVEPQWNWDVLCNLRATDVQDNKYILSVEFLNTSVSPSDSPNVEPFLFDTRASFCIPSDIIKPFELELAPRGFRYNRDVWGRGINCAVMYEKNKEAFATFVTTHSPIYTQLRYSTREEPHAKFADLANDPLPTLSALLEAMRDYHEIWEIEYENYIRSDPKWESKFGEEFNNDRSGFDDEIARFNSGYELIKNISDVRKAFELTNETFRRGTKTEWRLFQIVFIVSQIPGIVELSQTAPLSDSDREKVDIIYFPTGGGKTEAYLGLIVFHCFYDRLRGKKAGITAWTRFPLRLLTLQQTQRVADVIGLAELVRIEQIDTRLSGDDVDGFAVGYFVGQGGSPNEIVNPEVVMNPTSAALFTWSKVNDIEKRQDWKRVMRCPSCRTNTVSIDFDVNSTSLIHRCSQPNCRFPNGKLPIYIVDNEIFRNLPCVIVGTIDKLAGIGNQRKFALLFGQVDGRCSLHGYYKSRCCQKDCTDHSRLLVGKPEGLTGPTLFVQDELHLLKEGLGTFDGHYETFIQTLLREFGQNHSLKIIASSATIEAFQRQVNHLYGRNPSDARVFPGQGPTLGQSFYAQTLSIPARLYVGILPHNKTIFNTILELIELYHRELQGLQNLNSNINPYGGHLAPDSIEWKQLLDFYTTTLTYFSVGHLLNSIRTDLEGDVIPNLQRDGLSSLNISELTGNTPTDDVTRILDKLESQSSSSADHDTVLATSMVSHGVDIDRLNSMIFYGMPRQNAEYIQASSRVGRSHVGIVFTCLHPVRERDQSHYSYYNKFHEFLGQLVEPVAINRWSRFSVNRTLPGLFMGVLLQLIASRSQHNPGKYSMLDFVRGQISNGSICANDFIPVLENAYGVYNPTELGEIAFYDEINLRVQQYLDWILSPNIGSSFVSEVLIPKPMISLRDVDEAIPIVLDTYDNQWTGRSRR